MAIHTTTAAVNPLAKADIDIAALPCMKSSPVSATALADQLCIFPAPDHNRAGQGNGVE
jgi:hypothetical protein